MPCDEKARRWAFVNGEHHDEIEDGILVALDLRVKGLATIMDQYDGSAYNCTACGEPKECSVVRGKLLCRDCRRELLAKSAAALGNPLPRPKRGGPYKLQAPGQDKPTTIYAPTERVARDVYARQLGRQRVPRGTKVWTE